MLLGLREPLKNSGSLIDASHSRQPLIKGERLVRYEVNAVMTTTGRTKLIPRQFRVTSVILGIVKYITALRFVVRTRSVQKSVSGYIAQWLERLTADQQVPGSNPGVPFLCSSRRSMPRKVGGGIACSSRLSFPLSKPLIIGIDLRKNAIERFSCTICQTLSGRPSGSCVWCAYLLFLRVPNCCTFSPRHFGRVAKASAC